MEQNNPLKVFIVSLDRAVERRQYMSDLVAKIGMTANFISAVDGSRLTPEQRAKYNGQRARLIYGCEMSNSEIGCYLSHLSIYSKMLEHQIDTALILEDDITCVGDLKQIIEDVMKLPRTSWQVVRLQSSKTNVSHPKYQKYVGEPMARIGDREIFRIRSSVVGGCAYLIRREAAAAMLERSESMDMPIDQTLDRYWENGIIPYVLRPMPVWHEDLFESEIGKRGRALQDGVSRKTLARRRWQRIVDGLNKRIFWLSFRVPSVGQALARMGVTSAHMAMVALWGAAATEILA